MEVKKIKGLRDTPKGKQRTKPCWEGFCCYNSVQKGKGG